MATNFSIRGVDIIFPFKAYDCQVAFMDGVIRAVQNGEHALLESPTGTGKTVSLLCASLAWRRQQDAAACLTRRSAERGAIGSLLSASGLSGSGSQHSAMGSPPFDGDDLLHGAAAWPKASDAGSSSAASSTALAPIIVYASRTHSQLTQVIDELKRTAYRPRTLVLGSRTQLCVNEHVRHERGYALDRCIIYLYFLVIIILL